jgi:hypothetical protein
MKNYFSTLLFFLLSLNFTSCNNDSNTTPTATNSTTATQPIVVIVGYDRSSSFSHFTPITSEHLQTICKWLTTRGKGGVIAFGTIGNSKDESLLRCVITPLPDAQNPDLTLSARAAAAMAEDEINKANNKAIEDFLAKAMPKLDPRFLETETDLNNFWSKCENLLQEPQLSNHEKIVFAYTDGVHDTQSSKSKKRLYCPNFEELGVTLCMSGWANDKAICKGAKTLLFESPEGFVSNLTANKIQNTPLSEHVQDIK